MEAAGAIDSAEKGASSETVEQATNSALKPEAVARTTSRRKQREHEREKKAAAEEAERFANAETQEEEPVMTTPVPVVRRPMPAPPPSSTTNREEPRLIADEYPSQVPPTQDEEVVGESPPLQRTRASSGVTDNQLAHNLFDGSQLDFGV